MNDFDSFVWPFIHAHEGGYVNDPKDPGGETKYGISKRQYPHLEIKSLTELDAKAIIFDDYWLKSKCNYIPFPLSLVVCDTAVNMGVRRSICLLQESIGVIVDGQFGDQTMERIFELNPLFAACNMINVRSWFYGTIMAKNTNLLRFRIGWKRRIMDLVEACFSKYL